MITGLTIINQENKEIKIDVLMSFKIKENGKQYIIYTVNDDGKSDDVYINISGLVEENGKYRLSLIPESERNMVLTFYDNIRDTISGNRDNKVQITNDEMMSEDEFYEGMLNYLDTCLQEIEESSQEGE